MKYKWSFSSFSNSLPHKWRVWHAENTLSGCIW